MVKKGQTMIERDKIRRSIDILNIDVRTMDEPLSHEFFEKRAEAEKTVLDLAEQYLAQEGKFPKKLKQGQLLAGVEVTNKEYDLVIKWVNKYIDQCILASMRSKTVGEVEYYLYDRTPTGMKNHELPVPMLAKGIVNLYEGSGKVDQCEKATLESIHFDCQKTLDEYVLRNYEKAPVKQELDVDDLIEVWNKCQEDNPEASYVDCLQAICDKFKAPVSAWISMEIDKPEIGKEVNVFCPKAKIKVTTLARVNPEREGGKGECFEALKGSHNTYIRNSVTHWQPLPTPPQE